VSQLKKLRRGNETIITFLYSQNTQILDTEIELNLNFIFWNSKVICDNNVLVYILVFCYTS